MVQIEENVDVIKNSNFMVLDGNIPVETITKAVDLAGKYEIPG